MARLRDAIEGEFTTDFASLIAEQNEAGAAAELVGTFATSAPGYVCMETGDKNSAVRVRVERWDARPDSVSDEWEDADELPWAPVPGGGPLTARCFDAVTEESLAVDDMGPSRVQIMARGRHQYALVEHEEWGIDDPPPEGPPPEDWLVRFWPEPGPANPLAGPPRRIAGPRPRSIQRSPWEAAVHGWEVSGWARHLGRLGAFANLENDIRRVGRPFERDDLLPLLDPFDWHSTVTGRSAMWPEVPMQPEDLDLVERLVAATGLPAVETYGDAFECLLRLGLIAECETPAGRRYVPNPAPDLISPVIELNESSRRRRDVRLFPHLDVGYLDSDLETVLRWSPNGLATTPRRVAIRLSVPPEDVVDALRLLAAGRRGAIDTDPHDIYVDTTVTLKSAPYVFKA